MVYKVRIKSSKTLEIMVSSDELTALKKQLNDDTSLFLDLDEFMINKNDIRFISIKEAK